MTKLTPFEFWTQKTLPQVYDESLSYYELLTKVVNHLNEVVESQNGTNDSVVKLQKWFDSLSVQGEVNEKLNELVNNGTLDKIINHNIFNNLSNDLNARTLEKYNNQVDFVELMKELTHFDSIDFTPVYAPNKQFKVSLKYAKNRHVTYDFSNVHDTAPDDYIKLGIGFVGSSLVDVFNSYSNYDSVTGSFVTNVPPNHYTQQVGATITKTFTGSGIDFVHIRESRGGRWKFVLDNDVANSVYVSTYLNTGSRKEVTPLFSKLEYKQHTIVGTFEGDDPDNPPSSGVGTARGWVSYGSGEDATFRIYNQVEGLGTDISVLNPSSNKEYAWHVRKKGSQSEYEWFPTHGVPTAFKVEKEQIFVDNVLINLDTTPTIKGAKNFKLVQTVNCVHSNFPNNPLIRLTTVHSLTLDGVMNITGKAIFLEDTEIDYGYNLMVPAITHSINALYSGIKNYYPLLKTDGSRTNLNEENDKVGNYIFLNRDRKSYGIGFRMNDIKRTLRQGKTDKYSSTVWVEHRNISMTKMYPQIFLNSNVNKGETIEFGGSYIIGEIPGLYDII